MYLELGIIHSIINLDAFATGARDGALLVWDTRIPEQVAEVTNLKPDMYIYLAHEGNCL